MSARVGTFAAITFGFFLHSLCGAPQNYTISAKPGLVNYIEGTVYLNGAKLSEAANRNTIMSAGDVLSSDNGKAEVLLAPGIFLRIGEQSDIRMVSPSLVDTQVAVVRGEAILEVAGLIKGSTVQVTDHGATITIEKDGLYRFKADEPPSAAVLEGKASVYFGQEKLQLGKNHETILTAGLKSEKFNPKQEDELYAWSNVRSEYEAAATYQAAKTAASAGNSGFAYGYTGGLYGPGWLWNTAFNSWCWLPGSGAFYSPFGWGFYSPAVVGYAPVVTTGVYRGGHWDHNGSGSGTGNGQQHHHWNGTSTTAAVPVRTDHPPAVGVIAASPWATQQARSQAARSLAATGAFNPAAAESRSFGASAHIAAPAPAAVRGGGWSGGPSGGHPAAASGGGWAGHPSGGGWAGGAAHGGGGAPAGGGGGHAGGGAPAGGGGGHAGGGGGGHH